MTDEKRPRRKSGPVLAESAASWVPPWAREPTQALILAVSEPRESVVRDAALNTGYLTRSEAAPRARMSIDPLTSELPVVDLDDPGVAEDLVDPAEFAPMLVDDFLRGALEAIMLVVDEPVSTIVLAQVLEEPTRRVEETLELLAKEYASSGRGFELRAVAGGWRLYTRGEFAAYVERFVLDGQQIRLTQAALETLAVVAYKQPVTRSRVSAIRGVNCDGVIKTLVNRGLIQECGAEASSGAHLYQTTRLFLEKIGINDLSDLPSLAPFLPENVEELEFAQR